MLETCAFCEQEISPDVEVFGFGAKANAGIDLSDKRGTVIDMFFVTLGRTVPAVVTSLTSDAFHQGWDVYFMTCSEACVWELKSALEADKEILNG